MQIRLRFFGDFLVVAGDVAHADLSENLVAVFHHHDDNLQRAGRFGAVGNHRTDQMRDLAVRREFHLLRID